MSSMKHSNYFEAILQLREVKPEVVEFTESAANKLKLEIVKKSKVRGGIDYHLDSNDKSRKLAKKIQLHFGGQVKITATLHTKKKNKELYRLTILFRQIPFSKNNLVDYQGEEWNVKSITKDILLQNIKTGKKVHVRYKDAREVKLC